MTQLISFSELTGGNQTVRVTVKDGKSYMSIRDIITLVCKKSTKRAREAWDRLDQDKKNEIAAFCGEFQFRGQGERVQPVITLKGALKLIEWLPGENAKNYRGQVVEIMTRYLAGDASMHEELEANAASSAPLNVLAREEVGSKRVRNDAEDGEAQLRLVRQTQEALDQMVLVSSALGSNLAQQRADATFMLDIYEKISSAQLRASNAQCEAEKAKQETFSVDVRSTKDKVLIDLEHRKELAKLLSAERSEELTFIERKQKLLAPPKETAAPQPSQPKTMLDIAQGLHFWPGLQDHVRCKVLNKAGGMVKAEQIMPLPDKVEQQSPYGNTTWQVCAYDANDHSVIRSVLRRAYEDMTRRTPSARLRAATPGWGRQQGIQELPGFAIIATKPRVD